MGDIASFKQAIKHCKSLTIICIGNSDRGDDAAAFKLYEELKHFLHCGGNTLYKKNISIIFKTQLQVEDVMIIPLKQPTLIIDAAMNLESNFALERVTNPAHCSPLSHALTPSQLLRVCDQIQIPRPENLWQLAIKGQQFELGDPISDDCRETIGVIRKELLKFFKEWRVDLVKSS